MTRPANQQFRIGRRLNVARNARAVELYLAGASTGEVGRRLGTTSTHVLYMLRRAGIAVRSRAEGLALARRRAERLRLIAEAAQRKFGHLRVASVAERDTKPSNMPAVNPGFEDDVLEQGWEDTWS